MQKVMVQAVPQPVQYQAVEQPVMVQSMPQRLQAAAPAMYSSYAQPSYSGFTQTVTEVKWMSCDRV
jgi:hypothetical protein